MILALFMVYKHTFILAVHGSPAGELCLVDRCLEMNNREVFKSM